MKKLNDLYPGVGTDIIIKGITINSKQCEKGDLLVCTMGVTADRHDFIDEAIDISKDFGSDDSYKFINAVLDNVRKSQAS